MTDYKLVPVDLLSELAESLASELDVRYPASVRSYESQDRKYQAEMEPVLTARQIIAAGTAVQEEPVAWGAFYVGGKYNGQLHRHDSSEEEIDRYIAIVHGSNDSLTLRKGGLYTKPVPAEQQPEPDKERLLADAEDLLHRLREWKTHKGVES